MRLELSGVGLLPQLKGEPGGDVGIEPLEVLISRSGDLFGDEDGRTVAPITVGMGQGGTEWIDETSIVVEVGPAGGLSEGTWSVELSRGQTELGLFEDAFVAVGVPTVGAVSPDVLCSNVDSIELTLTVAGLVLPKSSDEDGLPIVLLAGSPVEVVSVEDCLPLAADPSLQACSTVRVRSDGLVLPEAGADIRLDSPQSTSCGGSTPIVLPVLPPPVVHSVDPELSCVGGATVVISGDGFGPSTEVRVNDDLVGVTILDSRHIEVELPESLAPGTHSVEVSANGGCAATDDVDVTVVAAPEIFFVDPPVTHTSVSVVATAMLTDVTAELTDVWLVDPTGGTAAAEASWDPENPGQLRVLLPAGMAPGTWGLGFETTDGCGTELAEAFEVSDTLQVAITEVIPPYAWAYDYTPVEVVGPEATWGLDPFKDTPRVYLSARDGATAEPFAGVGFRSANRLSGVVPFGLAPGEYDVLVINPDGALGLLEAGLTITEQRPPRVDSVSPTSMSASQDTAVTIRGRGFDEPWVRVKCVEDGALIGRRGVVTDWSEDRVLAVLPSSQWNQALCVLEVNNADGAWSDFASLSVRNPADNLFPWEVGPTLVEPRRAPTAVAGRTTPLSRYVYAMGGDDGTHAGAMSSVERAPMGVYGDLGDWAVLQGQGTLPTPITMAAAVRLDDYIYLVGGNDGSSRLATVWRSRVLDPLEVPFLKSVGLERGSGEELAPGRWSWRVAATYASDDPSNPGGESLPGEVISVVVPESGAAVRLSWTSVPDAEGYRVYRIEAPDAPSNELGFVADVLSDHYQDVGTSVDRAQRPLVEGALGMWAPLPDMLSAREAPCLALVPDPHPDPVRYHLYAAGGLGAGGSPRADVERLDIRVASPREQLFGTWTVDSNTLSEARYACAGFSVDSAWHSVVEEGESYVIFAGGLLSSGRATGTTDGAAIGENGALVDWGELTSITPGRGAFAGASVGNNIYVFGGQNGRPSSGGVSASLDPDFLPDVVNWNSLGMSLDQARLFPGWAQESAVLIVVGGTTNSVGASNSVEVTHY